VKVSDLSIFFPFFFFFFLFSFFLFLSLHPSFATM
jgi:hypothetical protein